MADVVIRPVGKGRVDIFLNGKLIGAADLSIDGSYRGQVKIKRLV